MKWLQDFASLVYPRVCNGCGNTLFKHEEAICNACFTSLPRTNFHLHPSNPVQKIFYGRADVQFASSFLLFEKKGVVQNLLHALKYKSRPEVGFILGKWYAQDLKKQEGLQFDAIVPVPLHEKRMRKRGYNQSEKIAHGLAEEMQISVYANVLRKTVATETQTFKSREERWQNTLESFRVDNADRLKGKHLLLVDDVITTGATTEACILQLNKIPDVRISIASIAYTA